VLCQVEEVKEVTKELFSRIFATLLLRIGVSSCMEAPDSKKKPTSIRCRKTALTFDPKSPI